MSHPPRQLSEHHSEPAQTNKWPAPPTPPIQRAPADPAEQVIGLLLCLAPLFLLTLRGWSNAILILGASACAIFLGLSLRASPWDKSQDQRAITLAVATLLSPILAITISSMLRNSLYWPLFDSPARFCLAIPVFIFAVRTKFDASKLLQFAFPAASLITLAQQHLMAQPMLWGTSRMASYFADPLVFGYASMTFGLLSAVSINLLERDDLRVLAFKVGGAFAGFYLSIQSGSRTGWMAIPVVLAVWAYQHRSGKKQVQVAGVVAASALTSAMIYATSSTVHPRVDLIFNEFLSYPWTGVAPDNAVGSRITFLRMAWDMFFQSPAGGFGDTRFEQFPVPQKIQGYASDRAIHTAFNSGFHNEIVTNAIRSGIFGLVASLALFAMPIAVFARKLKSDDRISKSNAVIGITFVICMLASSLSTEVFDLKFMASFYALTVALLCGSTLARHGQD
jgi:O-antigen ligase